MDSMEERRSAIVNFVNEKGNVTFTQLKEQFQDVSEMTLRTDLKNLDEAKRIVRVHGGAKSVEIVLGTDDLMGKRSVRNVEAKQEIVKKTLELIRPNTTVFLDSGSTATMLAENWPDQPNFIFTNSLSCAMALAKLKQPKVFLTGGELNPYSLSVCGIETLSELKKVSFDTIILGTTTYDREFGFSCGAQMESYMKQLLVKQHGTKIMIFDTSKIGKTSTFHFCDLKDIDIIVTEDSNKIDLQKECLEFDVELV